MGINVEKLTKSEIKMIRRLISEMDHYRNNPMDGDTWAEYVSVSADTVRDMGALKKLAEKGIASNYKASEGYHYCSGVMVYRSEVTVGLPSDLNVLEALRDL